MFQSDDNLSFAGDILIGFIKIHAANDLNSP